MVGVGVLGSKIFGFFGSRPGFGFRDFVVKERVCGWLGWGRGCVGVGLAAWFGFRDFVVNVKSVLLVGWGWLVGWLKIVKRKVWGRRY